MKKNSNSQSHIFRKRVRKVIISVWRSEGLVKGGDETSGRGRKLKMRSEVY